MRVGGQETEAGSGKQEAGDIVSNIDHGIIVSATSRVDRPESGRSHADSGSGCGHWHPRYPTL